MDELTKLLLKRYAEIDHRAAGLRIEIDNLENERAKVSAAAEAINVDLEELISTHAHYLSPILRRPEPNDEKKNEQADLTIKEVALRLLEGKTNGMTANEILAAMFNEYQMHYPRSSLSPQLSRLKAEGEIELEEGRWRRITNVAGHRSTVRRI